MNESNDDDPDPIPSFAELAADPAIAALLEFEPVPRKRAVEGGWTPALQQELVARLADGGSPGGACKHMGKDHTGLMKVYHNPAAASFRGAWHAAIALYRERREASLPEGPAAALRAPAVDHRRKYEAPVPDDPDPFPPAPAPDHDAVRDHISAKLRNSRRLYLAEICDSPGKRAAFEILTQLPIDWERAARLEPQADEPWRTPNMRRPDMLLAAENGWMGDMVHGPDKKAELRAALDAHLAALGREGVDWGDEG